MKSVCLKLMATLIAAAFVVTAAAPAEAAVPCDDRQHHEDIQVFNGPSKALSGMVYTIVRDRCIRNRREQDRSGLRVYIGPHAGPGQPYLVLRDGRVKFGNSDWVLFTLVEKDARVGAERQVRVARGRSARLADAMYTIEQDERRRLHQVFLGATPNRRALAYQLVGERVMRPGLDRPLDAWLCSGGPGCGHKIFTIRGAMPDDLDGDLLPLLTVLAESEFIPSD